MNIAVIGLGLMGASLAKALQGFGEAVIIGSDIDEKVCRLAVEGGVVVEAWTDPGQAIKRGDWVIFATYARHVPKIIENNLDKFRPGLLLSDICGVKHNLYEVLEPLIPAEVDYIGLHPMAGKERDGFENADPAIYKNSGLIICPWTKSSLKAVNLMKQMADYIGVARLAVVSPDKQDEIIAYTSSLMHIASAALCLDFHPDINPAFTAGAFRDCTRIADINAEAWTELLLENKTHTIQRLDKYIENLGNFRQALIDMDDRSLKKMLTDAGDNKRKILEK